MKKLMVIAVMMLGMTSFAQERPVGTEKPTRAERESLPGKRMTAEERSKKQLETMTKELNLTAAQQKEVSSLLAENQSKREAKKAEREKAMTAKKAEMKKEMEANDAKMKKILTADQYTKWETLKAEKKAKMKHRVESRKKAEK